MPDNHIEKLKIDLNNISTENELLNIKSKYLGKKGQITTMTTTLKDLSIEKKKVEGQKINIYSAPYYRPLNLVYRRSK